MRPKVCLLLRILWIFDDENGKVVMESDGICFSGSGRSGYSESQPLRDNTQLNHIYGLLK